MLFEQITLRNLLSFKDATIDLKPLNILIGENTAGKSNLIEAISLLQSVPSEIRVAILRGGGARYWVWMGDGTPGGIAHLGCSVGGVRYELEFAEDPFGMVIPRERLLGADGEVYFDRTNQSVDIGNIRGQSIGKVESVFSLFKNPADETPTTEIGRRFERIRIYREFQTGPRAGSRQGIAAGNSGDFLRDGGDNLATVLLELQFHDVLDRVNEYLGQLSSRIQSVRPRLDESGIARTFLREKGLSFPLPSVRMSDGSLKFLCLLAVLLHPEPGPLVCLEEPEQGLHPDAIQIVAQALREASERTQLIVTTHSRELVDAFSDEPESVLVCERGPNEDTQCRRLVSSELDDWLNRYTLGELWRKGEIGATRW